MRELKTTSMESRENGIRPDILFKSLDRGFKFAFRLDILSRLSSWASLRPVQHANCLTQCTGPLRNISRRREVPQRLDLRSRAMCETVRKLHRAP